MSKPPPRHFQPGDIPTPPYPEWLHGYLRDDTIDWIPDPAEQDADANDEWVYGWVYNGDELLNKWCCICGREYQRAGWVNLHRDDWRCDKHVPTGTKKSDIFVKTQENGSTVEHTAPP